METNGLVNDLIVALSDRRTLTTQARMFKLLGSALERVYDSADTMQQCTFDVDRYSGFAVPALIAELEKRGLTVTDREPDEDGAHSLTISW